MKLLDKEIKTNGHTYTQVKRNKRIALYEQKTKDGILAGHELFLIRIAKEGEIFGTFYEEREVYPSTTDFGNSAWSVGVNREYAEKKYRELNNRLKSKDV